MRNAIRGRMAHYAISAGMLLCANPCSPFPTRFCCFGYRCWGGKGVWLPTEILGSLSNHDGDANGNVTLKMACKYFKLFHDSFNSFKLSNVAEQSGC